MARRGENIRKRKDGRWEGRYTCRQDNGSKSRVYSVYARSYREVREKLAAAKQAAAVRDVQQPDKEIPDFTDIAEQWLSSILDTKKYATYIKYRQIYEKYLKDLLKGLKPEDVTREKMETAILPKAREKLGTDTLSQSLEKSICCVAGQALIYSARKYHTAFRSLSGSSSKTARKPVRIFDSEEQQKLRAYLEKDMDLHKLGIRLCLYTGLRLGELCALKWTDIDLENRLLRVRATVQRLPVQEQNPEGKKTALIETEPKSFCSRREIPLNDNLCLLLSACRHGHKYLIGLDKAADPRTYQKKFAAYLKEIGIPGRPFHTLRHTFASNCAACGADAKTLSEILGHSGVQITLNRYVHPSMNLKRNCLNLLSTDLNGQKMGQAG